jgi:cellulase/cellobiase CelA1
VVSYITNKLRGDVSPPAKIVKCSHALPMVRGFRRQSSNAAEIVIPPIPDTERGIAAAPWVASLTFNWPLVVAGHDTDQLWRSIKASNDWSAVQGPAPKSRNTRT